MDYTKHLNEQGWVTIPCLEPHARKGELRQKLRDVFKNNPEFIDGRKMMAENEKFQQGGCAFTHVGQHDPFCRLLRVRAHSEVLKKVFGPMLEADSKLQFEQCFDRTMIRRPSQTPGKESFHRDESPGALPTDTVYGGWINLDPFPQYFSGCPGTHKEVSKNRGFAKIGKEELKKYKGKQKLIPIAPGHIFIFYERMVHEVLPSKKKEDQHRMFLGWRTTYSKEPLVPNVEELIKLQAPMPIKSGQQCTQYSQMHWTNWRPRLSDWSVKNFKPQFLCKRTVKSGKEAGKTYTVVQRTMKPLKAPGMEEAGIYHYPEYEPHEIDIMKPGRTFKVLEPGSLIMFETLDFTPKKRGRDVMEGGAEGIESDESDDEGSCPDTCACEACDTKDPTHWAYNTKGEYVCMSLDDDFEEDEHGNYSLKTDAKEPTAKRRRVDLPVLRGTLKHFDESKQRFVDDDDDFDPENGYVIYFKNRDNEIRIGQSWDMLYLQEWDGEIVCHMGGYGGGTCLLGDNIRCLSTALQTLYKNFEEFNYDRIFVEETLWDKERNDEFITEVESIGAKDILVVS